MSCPETKKPVMTHGFCIFSGYLQGLETFDVFRF
ncbi:hypothetical protein CGJ63_07910 [Vibrio parahaemolyticus]|nr:hypothetical protein CGJ63_07910 [Vibrio parahaemolyticus]TOD82239.1 hypothetical protein CGJ58_05625 [Vibrio parahaemolyticus]